MVTLIQLFTYSFKYIILIRKKITDVFVNRIIDGY